MFIRTTKNSAGQRDYHLVESFREDGKVRQRTLLSLGRVEDGKLEQLAAAIAKHTGLLSALDIAKTVGVDNTFISGPLLVLCGLFAKLGIDAALLRLEHAHPRLDFAFRRFIFVADRGLLSKANLDPIREVGGEFIVGMRIGGLVKKRPEH